TRAGRSEIPTSLTRILISATGVPKGPRCATIDPGDGIDDGAWRGRARRKWRPPTAGLRCRSRYRRWSAGARGGGRHPQRRSV
ncbi:hypothetical protein C1X24_27410, partial [Pseudomonas sp. FW305-124]